jgi:hypothetical protein
MNQALLSCVGLCLVIAGCTSHPALSTHASGHAAPPAALSPQPGVDSELRKFDIPAGDARVALNEFSRQSNLQVLFDFTALRDRQTPAVEGMLRPEEALNTMLLGMGLVFRYVNENTVAIATDR